MIYDLTIMIETYSGQNAISKGPVKRDTDHSSWLKAGKVISPIGWESPPDKIEIDNMNISWEKNSFMEPIKPTIEQKQWCLSLFYRRCLEFCTDISNEQRQGRVFQQTFSIAVMDGSHFGTDRLWVRIQNQSIGVHWPPRHDAIGPSSSLGPICSHDWFTVHQFICV